MVLANTLTGLTFFEKPNGSVVQAIEDAIQPPPDSAGLTIADLNQDGRPEVIFSSETFADVAGTFVEKGILTIQSQDEFGNYQELDVELDVGDDPGALKSGDMDGDSIADILLISPEKKEFRVAFIGPQNDLPAVLALDVHSTNDPNGKAAEPVDLEIGDLNGDGINEVVVLIGEGVPSLNIFERGTGRTVQLRAGGAVALPQFSQNEVSDLLIGDVSRDGREDIIVSGGTQVLAYLQRSDGTFDFTNPTIVLSDGEVNFQSAALADLNGDGFLDVAAVAQYPPTSPDLPLRMTLQYVFQEDLSDSQVTKLFGNSFSLGRFDGLAGILSAGDLNNDGLADFAFQINNDTIRVQFQSEQQGKITFTTGKNFSIGQGLTKFIIRDMNRDGLEDLVVYSSSLFDDDIGFDDGANRIIILQQD